MSKQRNLTSDFHVVQVTTVGNSVQMEKAGLKHLLEEFDKKGNKNLFFSNR